MFIERRRRSAFTLIELVIVMLIAGILLAVAVPQYQQSIASFRVDAAAKRIAADLNLVRQNAISKSGAAQGEWARFDSSTDSYEMVYDQDLDNPSEYYWVYFSETAYPVDLVSANFTNKNDFTSTSTIKYDMHGLAKSGHPPTFPDAHLVLGEVVVASGGETRTVVINPDTGEASVQ